MDGGRFDDLARNLARRGDRRAFLAGLTGAVAGVVATGRVAAACPAEQVKERGGCVCKISGRPPGPDGCPCPSGQTRCPAGSDGVCVDLRRDATNCGVCGAVCSVGLNVDRVACEGGSCRIKTCLPSSADCDADPAIGCTPLGTTADCTACGDACRPEDETPVCLAGIGCVECRVADDCPGVLCHAVACSGNQCVYTPVNDGDSAGCLGDQVCCGGGCVELGTSDHCLECGDRCPPAAIFCVEPHGCSECTFDGGCHQDERCCRGFCTKLETAAACRSCDEICAGPTPVCHPTLGCVECMNNDHCGNEVCVNNRCQACPSGASVHHCNAGPTCCGGGSHFVGCAVETGEGICCPDAGGGCIACSAPEHVCCNGSNCGCCAPQHVCRSDGSNVICSIG